MGVAQTERESALVHARYEPRAAMVGERPAGVVRRMHDRRGEEVARAQQLAGAKADAAAVFARRSAAHHYGLVELAALEHEERGHHLREARGRMARVLRRGPQHAA